MLPGLKVVELRIRAAMRLKSPSSAAFYSLNFKAFVSAVQILNGLQVVIGCLRRGIVPGNSRFGWNPAVSLIVVRETVPFFNSLYFNNHHLYEKSFNRNPIILKKKMTKLLN